MKRLFVLLAFVLFVAGGVSAIESPMYAKAVFIQKITSHEKGYRVTYYTAHGDLKTVYIPLDWFYPTSQYKTSDGFVKAELYRGRGPSYPYMEIFWKDGKFHHVRLFVVSDYNDRSWGILKPGEDAALADKFDPAGSIDFQF
jgi:hypothetical protein